MRVITLFISCLRSKVIVQPPKPPPVIRDPSTSEQLIAASTNISSSSHETSKSSRSDLCDSCISCPICRGGRGKRAWKLAKEANANVCFRRGCAPLAREGRRDNYFCEVPPLQRLGRLPGACDFRDDVPCPLRQRRVASGERWNEIQSVRFTIYAFSNIPNPLHTHQSPINSDIISAPTKSISIFTTIDTESYHSDTHFARLIFI